MPKEQTAANILLDFFNKQFNNVRTVFTTIVGKNKNEIKTRARTKSSMFLYVFNDGQVAFVSRRFCDDSSFIIYPSYH